MDYPSIANHLGPLYTTDGSANGTKYSNEKVDELLAGGVATHRRTVSVSSGVGR